ncbi:hypothetical protein HK100_006314 [Physocladia obscura]|uniref:BZIP domain-containing protein n=1 Tax=Physocladia obscura TaxID=109957 RepID=A0AAD5SW94_9FUNG|nr:hypothetical protein HK100_006314 [Physocladia obscura]
MNRVMKRKAGRPTVAQPATERHVQRQRETSRNFRRRKADHLRRLEEAAQSCTCGAFARPPDCGSSEDHMAAAASHDRIADLEAENASLRQMLAATNQNIIALAPIPAPALLQINDLSFPDANTNLALPLNDLNISADWSLFNTRRISKLGSPTQSQNLISSKLVIEKPFLEYVAEMSLGLVRQKLLNIPVFGMQSELVAVLCECFKGFTLIMNEFGPGPDDGDNILDRPEFLPIRKKIENCFMPKAVVFGLCLVSEVQATVVFTMKRARREHRSYVLKVLNNENPFL